MQIELPLVAVISSQITVDRAVVEGFRSTSEAIKWSFDHRTNPGGKSIEWLAKHIGVRRQRLSRILNHVDFKLDTAKVALWDCLVGNKAVSQFVEIERERLVAAIAMAFQEAINQRMLA